MNLFFDPESAYVYRSWPQKIRVMSEQWLHNELFCPACGRRALRRCENNSPVADFVCDVEDCGEQFELKSKDGAFGRKIVDGAYDTMMSRLNGDKNPNLILLSYARASLSVQTLHVIPKQFFTPQIVERRPALSSGARRSGWVGCNILVNRIPATGRISIVDCGKTRTSTDVVWAWNKVLFIRRVQPGSLRGWLLAVVEVVENLGQQHFTLHDVYRYAPALAANFPANHNVHAKIRQQLQVLRDQGYLKFLGNGTYLKAG